MVNLYFQFCLAAESIGQSKFEKAGQEEHPYNNSLYYSTSGNAPRDTLYIIDKKAKALQYRQIRSHFVKFASFIMCDVSLGTGGNLLLKNHDSMYW